MGDEWREASEQSVRCGVIRVVQSSQKGDVTRYQAIRNTLVTQESTEWPEACCRTRKDELLSSEEGGK